MIDRELYDEMCAECFPVFKKFCLGEEYSITLGGSHGKGVSDINSDFDFRIYGDILPWQEINVKMKDVLAEVDALVEKWDKRGVKIDGVWPRSVAEVNAQLDSILSGKSEPPRISWTVWGYHMLTDLYNQMIVEDPYGIAQRWKDRLCVYPETLKKSILARCGYSLRYWRKDYHYRNKVNRQDPVFLASIAPRLVNDMMQAIYALNEFYFPGDGMNLLYTKKFLLVPENLEERVTKALYPCASSLQDAYRSQYEAIIGLIDDTLKLMEENV